MDGVVLRKGVHVSSGGVLKFPRKFQKFLVVYSVSEKQSWAGGEFT